MIFTIMRLLADFQIAISIKYDRDCDLCWKFVSHFPPRARWGGVGQVHAFSRPLARFRRSAERRLKTLRSPGTSRKRNVASTCKSGGGFSAFEWRRTGREFVAMRDANDCVFRHAELLGDLLRREPTHPSCARLLDEFE